MRPVAPLLALLLAGAAVPASAMDLAEALAAARARNPDLAVAAAEGEAAAARQRRARAARGPTVALNAMAADGESDLGGFFGFQREDVTPSSAAIELTQPLFASGALRAGMEGAAADRRRAGQALRAAEARLTVAVTEAYADVRVAEQALDTARRQVSLTAEVARQAAERFEAGEIPRSDYAQATAGRAQALAERAAAEAALETARAEFERIVGQPAEGLASLPDAPGATEDLDGFLARAAASSPEIGAAEAQVAVARAGLRAARAAYGPNVALTAQAAQVRDQFLPGYRSDEWRVGVQGRWVLFDSGSTAAAVAERAAGLRAAEARLRAARDAAEAQALSAFHAARAAELRRSAAAAALEASAISARSVADEVAAAQRPLVDRLDAEARLANAERAKAQADREGLVSVCRRQAVVGDAGCGGLFQLEQQRSDLAFDD